MARIFVPAPMPLRDAELEVIRCSIRSGVAPNLEEARRLLATIDANRTALAWKRSRELDESPEALSEGVVVAGRS